jgi:hypothetical protein
MTKVQKGVDHSMLSWDTGSEQPSQPSEDTPPPEEATPAPDTELNDRKYKLGGAVALLGLLLCIVLPLGVFFGESPQQTDALVAKAVADADPDASSILVEVPDLDQVDPQAYGNEHFGGTEPKQRTDSDDSVLICDYGSKSLVFMQMPADQDAYLGNMADFKRLFLFATVLYFMGAIAWFDERQKRKARKS